MDKELKKKKNILKPYNFFVALISQPVPDEDPIFVKLLYNDFSVTPEFSCRIDGAGEYRITVTNYADLKIPPIHRSSIGVEFIISGSASPKIEAFLSTDHSVFNIRNYELSFQSLDYFTGSYVIHYYNYY